MKDKLYRCINKDCSIEQTCEPSCHWCGCELVTIENNNYTEADIVSFGNFLLSDRGDGNYLMSNKEVTHTDLENWKELNKQEDEKDTPTKDD